MNNWKYTHYLKEADTPALNATDTRSAMERVNKISATPE